MTKLSHLLSLSFAFSIRLKLEVFRSERIERALDFFVGKIALRSLSVLPPLPCLPPKKGMKHSAL